MAQLPDCKPPMSSHLDGTIMKRLWYTLPLLGIIAVGAIFFTQRSVSAPSDNRPVDESKANVLKPTVNLPISQVILFNSGVGHFTRSGEVEGEARVDLSFPEQDINDLIK